MEAHSESLSKKLSIDAARLHPCPEILQLELLRPTRLQMTSCSNNTISVVSYLRSVDSFSLGPDKIVHLSV